jgi:hypothetical protein
LSKNPSCAPKRFRGKNYSHSAAASTEIKSKQSFKPTQEKSDTN